MTRQDFTRLEEAVCHAVTEAIDAFVLSLDAEAHHVVLAQAQEKCHRLKNATLLLILQTAVDLLRAERDLAQQPPVESALAQAREERLDLHAEVARLTAELARWKVCENCGGMLDGPGICSEAISEREKGLEAMHAETLTRAEMAEAELHEWRGYASFLAVHGLNPPAPASVSKEQP